MDRVVRVLVVDDSAYVRKVVRQMLSRSPFLEVVGQARDGVEALELAAELQPDVITLDLIMPRMDGVTFLREQMARRPVPVIVLSIASESGELMLQALEAGAIDLIQKPTALATERVYEIAEELIEKVKAAAQTRLQHVSTVPADNTPIPPAALSRGAVDIVVLGISTGGPQALKYLVPRLPADFPVPLTIVLHMPEGFTELYAKSLADIARMKVVEAHEGDRLRPGVALLAPGGQHLTCRLGSDGLAAAHLDLLPLGTPHRPSVDVLFQSAAELYGDRALAVIMTGMGSDGTRGAAWIKAQGGKVITEAEETCVVYGMPRSVVEAGLSDRVVPLTGIAQAILEEL